MKLSQQAFIELNDDLVQAFYEAATIDKWQGHRLLAVYLLRILRYQRENQG